MGRVEESCGESPPFLSPPARTRPPPPRRPRLSVGRRLAPVKSALVTGGSAGIGLALAHMLRDEGYALTLAARRPEPLAEAAQELGAESVAANLADPDECVRAVAAHAEKFGGMDVLVNSAGIGIGGSFGEQATKAIDLQLGVNLRAALVVTREALPLLRTSRGHIINLASIAGTIPTPGLAVYGATKAALISFTRSLNREEEEQRGPCDRDLPRLRRDAHDRVDRAPGGGADPALGRLRARARDPAPEPEGPRATSVIERLGDVV